MRGTRPHLQLLHDVAGDHGGAGRGVILEAVTELGDTFVSRDQEVLRESDVCGRQDVVDDAGQDLGGERIHNCICDNELPLDY